MSHMLQRLLQNEIADRQVEGNLHVGADFEAQVEGNLHVGAEFEAQVEGKAQKVAAC
jgi:hypothetical protein